MPATRQRHGLDRWLHDPVAEPLARRSRTMTLFAPEYRYGFIAPANGTVTLRRILIAADLQPSAQAAIEGSFFLAEGVDCCDVQFKLLHVGTATGMPTLFLPHHPGYQWGERMLNGDPMEVIARKAALWSADVIVFTTQRTQRLSRRAARRLLPGIGRAGERVGAGVSLKRAGN